VDVLVGQTAADAREGIDNVEDEAAVLLEAVGDQVGVIGIVFDDQDANGGVSHASCSNTQPHTAGLHRRPYWLLWALSNRINGGSMRQNKSARRPAERSWKKIR